LSEQRQEPVKVLALLDIVQMDILEDYQLLIVLSGKPFFAGFRIGFEASLTLFIFQKNKLSHSLWMLWIR
jgi:hypothetical protein